MSQGYIVGLRFDEARPVYCFYSAPLKRGDKAVVEMDDNDYLGVCDSCRESKEGEDLSIYEAVERIATNDDLSNYEQIQKGDIELIKKVQQQAASLSLNMQVFRVYTSLDRQKVKIMYTADERVDFRVLLRVLSYDIHARIEMRQVGPRDKAKMVGGLGVCGLKLCCASFLSAFEGISISMAKNQMLTINIPKLSGQCGKLICCLKYEDQAYAEDKKDFPKIGTSIAYGGNLVKVSGFNILARTVNLVGDDNYYNIPLEEYNCVVAGKPYHPAPKIVASTDPNAVGTTIGGTNGVASPELIRNNTEFGENGKGQEIPSIAPAPVNNNSNDNRNQSNRDHGHNNNGNRDNYNRRDNNQRWHNNSNSNNNRYHGNNHGQHSNGGQPSNNSNNGGSHNSDSRQYGHDRSNHGYGPK